MERNKFMFVVFNRLKRDFFPQNQSIYSRSCECILYHSSKIYLNKRSFFIFFFFFCWGRSFGPRLIGKIRFSVPADADSVQAKADGGLASAAVPRGTPETKAGSREVQYFKPFRAVKNPEWFIAGAFDRAAKTKRPKKPSKTRVEKGVNKRAKKRAEFIIKVKFCKQLK